ncbi:MAG: class I SAM-dependent methyltransferase [bacterium]
MSVPKDTDWTHDFFRGMGLEVVRDPDRERTAPLEADWIRRVLGLRPGDRLLDIPCGTGRIARELAAEGIRVVAIDRSPEIIREAREAAGGVHPPPTFRVGDMLDLDEPPRFDAAINWWGSFGYFEDSRNREVVRRMVSALRPGGGLLLDAVNREHVRRHALERHDISWDDIRILHRVRWDDERERLEGIWEIRRRGRRRIVRSSIRLYTPSQLTRLAESVGLEEIRLFGDWTGRPYRRGSHRLVLAARRPL